MQDLIHHYVTAQNLYHVGAFVLTGAASVYTVQLIKVVKKNKYGKRFYQALNFIFNSLYTAAGAILVGGMTLGNGSKTALALTAFSAGYYRFHDSFLFKRFTALSADAGVVDAPVNPAVTAPTPPASQFAS